jgi:hypothetical protein
MEIRDPEGGRHLGWSGGGWWRLIFLWFLGFFFVFWISWFFWNFLEFFRNFLRIWRILEKFAERERSWRSRERPRSKEFLEIVFVFPFFCFLEKISEKFCKNGRAPGDVRESATDLSRTEIIFAGCLTPGK